jgi:hypothetical protein
VKLPVRVYVCVALTEKSERVIVSVVWSGALPVPPLVWRTSVVSNVMLAEAAGLPSPKRIVATKSASAGGPWTLTMGAEPSEYVVVTTVVKKRPGRAAVNEVGCPAVAQTGSADASACDDVTAAIAGTTAARPPESIMRDSRASSSAIEWRRRVRRRMVRPFREMARPLHER